MWENRISQHADAVFGPAAPPAVQPQSPALPQPASPTLVRQADIYRAAHARAVLDHQLGRLFNPDASVE